MLPERRRGERVSSTESRWYFTDPFFSTIYRLGAACALEHGVEIRSPLYDRRIIAFAATRPRTDHVGDTDGKRLLRRAMCNLLPQEVVATRPERTGIPTDYVARAIHELADDAVPKRVGAPTMLADLGIIDPVAFERSRASMVRYGRPDLMLPFFATVQTELWLRSRTQGGASRRRPVSEQHVDASTTEGSRVVAAIA